MAITISKKMTILSSRTEKSTPEIGEANHMFNQLYKTLTKDLLKLLKGIIDY